MCHWMGLGESNSRAIGQIMCTLKLSIIIIYISESTTVWVGSAPNPYNVYLPTAGDAVPIWGHYIPSALGMTMQLVSLEVFQRSR